MVLKTRGYSAAFVAALLLAALAPASFADADMEACAELVEFEYAAATTLGAPVQHTCKSLLINAPVTVAAGGTLHLDRSQLVLDADNGSLVVQAGGTLRLVGTPYNPANKPFTLGEGAAFQSFLVAEVHATGDDLEGAPVWAWNATGTLRLAGTLNETGNALLTLPFENITANASTDHLPWRVAVNHSMPDVGVAVAFADVVAFPTGTGRVVLDALDLSAANVDAGPPAWPDGGADLEAPPFIRTAHTVLAWQAAEDDHAADHYVLNHTVPNGTVTYTAVGAKASPTFRASGLVPGNHTFRVHPVDLAGQAGPESGTITVLMDPTLPVANVTVVGTPGPVAGHYRNNFSIRVNATDNQSGLDRVTVCLQSTVCETPSDLTRLAAAGRLVESQGTYNATVKVLDRAGNERVVPVNATLDLSLPDVHVRINPPLPTGQRGWYHRAPTITIDAQDVGPSGLHEVAYRLGPAANWTTYSAPFPINASGSHLLEARVIDRAGNTITASVSVPVDLETLNLSVRPETPAGPTGWHQAPVRVVVGASDNVSGVRTLAYRLGEGSWTPFQDPLVLAHSGSRELLVRATDAAGNPGDEASLVVRIDASAPIPPDPRWLVLDDGRVELDWTAKPPTDLVSGVARVFVERSGPDGNVTDRIEVQADTAKQAVGPFPTGVHRFRTVAEDLAGNTAQSGWAEFAIARSVAGLLSTADQDRVRGIVPLSFTPRAQFDPIDVRFLVDDAEFAVLTEAPFIVQWDTKRIPDGAHTVRVVARDASGREQVDEQVFVVSNAYGAVLADHAASMILATALIAAAAALGLVGLRQWRRWEA